MSAIALIDYGAGNLRSVHNALVAAGADDVAVTADPDILGRADRIVLPGVGAFAACMNGLSAIPGLIEAMEQRVRGEGAPFLGICVGMQLLADAGEEHGRHEGLGWIGGTVRAFTPAPGLRIPHMGWNSVNFEKQHPLVAGIPQDSYFYFVHSYYAAPKDPEGVNGTTEYGIRFCSIYANGNLGATQFHPEKSGPAGLHLYKNFIGLAG